MARTRREILQAPVAAVGACLAAGRLAAPGRIRAQSSLSPDAALQELLDGNKRFSSSRMTAFDEDLKILKQKTVDKQEPFAAVLSCADSRVPVEFIFDQSIGHIFVTRVAGNMVSPEIVATLEYGAAVLATKVILVMGHANCGAVKAAIEGKAAPGQISALYRHLQPAVAQAGSDLEGAIKANAKIQADLLRKSSTVIAEMLKDKRVEVRAAFYELGTGKVTLLE